MEGGTDEVRLTRTIRDSVFRDLFSQEEYLLELYRALHPEDDGVHTADLEIVTIERVLTEGVYNDLGFTVGDRLVVLVEAQSRWSPNMTTRMLIYLAETYRRFLEKRGLTLHDSKLVAMPAPELYVIYTGDRKSVPEELSFARDVLGGATSSVELTVRVLRGGGDDIVGQYVASTQVYEEVRMMNESAAWKARRFIDTCIERGILVSYLQGRSHEMTDMMFTLFDQERETRLYHERIRKRATEEGLAEGRERGLAEGRERGLAEGRAEGRTQGLAEGLAEGRAEGRAEGLAEGRAESVRNAMANLNLSADEAMDVLGVSAEERDDVLALLEQLPASA